MVQSVQENPFVPIAWQRDHSGMQGSDYITDPNIVQYKRGVWFRARDKAIGSAIELNSDVHRNRSMFDDKTIPETSTTKQLCNRLLEPFMWHTVLISGTEWENFFALRCPEYVYRAKKFRSWKDMVQAASGLADKHQDMSFDEEAQAMREYTTVQRLKDNYGMADIHMMALAEAMWDAMNESTPKMLLPGQWHIPFGDQIDVKDVDFTESTSFKVKVATARCARTSYTVFGEEGKPADYAKDIELHDRLAKSGHWSPFEHCARAMTQEEYETWFQGKARKYIPDGQLRISVESSTAGWCGNFRGFVQYRKTFKNENIT